MRISEKFRHIAMSMLIGIAPLLVLYGMGRVLAMHGATIRLITALFFLSIVFCIIKQKLLSCKWVMLIILIMWAGGAEIVRDDALRVLNNQGGGAVEQVYCNCIVLLTGISGKLLLFFSYFALTLGMLGKKITYRSGLRTASAIWLCIASLLVFFAAEEQYFGGNCVTDTLIINDDAPPQP